MYVRHTNKCLYCLLLLWWAAIATRYGLDDPVIESRWGGETFHTLPERLWSPPSVQYNGYRVPCLLLLWSPPSVQYSGYRIPCLLLLWSPPSVQYSGYRIPCLLLLWSPPSVQYNGYRIPCFSVRQRNAGVVPSFLFKMHLIVPSMLISHRVSFL